jgi:hypothetical protein
VALGAPGRCPGHDLIHFFLFDNSGSMCGGNDAIGNRFLETHHALQKLARHCTCGKEFAAAFHFDTPTTCDVPPTRLNRRGVRALEEGLTLPPDGAGISNLGPSLARVTDVVANNPDYTPVVTVLSDFELFDPPQVLEDLATFPGLVHAVVFRSQPPAVLVDAPDVIVTRVQPTDPPGAVAKAIFTSLTALRADSKAWRPFGRKVPTW